MKNIKNVLLEYWGYNKFKDQQEVIINSIISGSHTLVSLPTGGGKSLCYQLPSLIIGGTTLVISPLIALMEDQVRALSEIGISSFYFKSDSKNLTTDQQLDNCIYGNYSIVYCSPEKLKNTEFLNKISRAKIKQIAIDEAHCISEWGHEFRPSYRNIKDLIKIFPKATVTAFTGSANLKVKNDIIENLELTKFNIIESSYERKNIFYEINHVKDKINSLFKLIDNQSSIIYCNTRKSTEYITKKLSNKGFSVDYFHGGLSLKEKKEKLIKWQSEKIKTIVATSAFGMGIDKFNVRKVIHYDIPKSIENYYQESGRAGRDGRKSKAISLISSEDKKLFISQNIDSLPTKTDLINTYKKLCTHLQICVGEGENDYFDFNFNFFCTKYNINRRTTHSIFRFLENNGLIVLNYILKKKIKIHIHAGSKEIKDSIKLSNPQSKVIESLLRFYPNILDKKIEISVEKLVKLTGLNIKDINEYLKFYNNMNLIDLDIVNSDIQLLWLKPREDNFTINPLIKKLEEINKNKKIKFDRVIDFIYDDENCKTIELLRYFGEKKTINCKNCSSFNCK